MLCLATARPAPGFCEGDDGGPEGALAQGDRPAMRVSARFARSDQYAVEVRDAGQRDTPHRHSWVAEGVLDDLV